MIFLEPDSIVSYIDELYDAVNHNKLSQIQVTAVQMRINGNSYEEIRGTCGILIDQALIHCFIQTIHGRFWHFAHIENAPPYLSDVNQNKFSIFVKKHAMNWTVFDLTNGFHLQLLWGKKKIFRNSVINFNEIWKTILQDRKRWGTIKVMVEIILRAYTNINFADSNYWRGQTNFFYDKKAIEVIFTINRNIFFRNYRLILKKDETFRSGQKRF